MRTSSHLVQCPWGSEASALAIHAHRLTVEYNEEYATCAETFATLRIYPPESVDPAEVTVRLEVEPTRSQRKDDLRLSWFWRSARAYGGPMSAVEQLGRLAECGLDLRFDVCFSSAEVAG